MCGDQSFFTTDVKSQSRQAVFFCSLTIMTFSMFNLYHYPCFNLERCSTTVQQNLHEHMYIHVFSCKRENTQMPTRKSMDTFTYRHHIHTRIELSTTHTDTPHADKEVTSSKEKPGHISPDQFQHAHMHTLPTSIDVMRLTETDVHNVAEHTINDYWNVNVRSLALIRGGKNCFSNSTTATSNW